jgi:tRNA threonylcarbamoyladenosine biosynthesis protein TsaB
MRILSLDTSLFFSSVAWMEAGVVHGYHSNTLPAQQTAATISLLDQLLKEMGKAIHDADYIAVTMGPGSFTGIRIGLATAKALALAATKPVIGVTSLEAIAMEYQVKNNPILVVMDASRGQVYIQPFSETGVALADPVVVMPEWLKHHPWLSQTKMLVGNGCKLVMPYLSPVHHILAAEALPTAKGTALAAWAKIQVEDAGQLLLQPLAPFYLREPDVGPAQPIMP